jgi:hypothetical protein
VPAWQNDDGVEVQVGLLVGRKLDIFNNILLQLDCAAILTKLFGWANLPANRRASMTTIEETFTTAIARKSIAHRSAGHIATAIMFA